MPVEPINDVIQAALAYQRARIEAAAHNIATANQPLAPGAGAALKTAGAPPPFAQQLDGAVASTAAPDTGAETGPNADVRLALEPGNPAADENGVVRYPRVDLATEMTTMMSASRAYEATVRSYNIMKTLNVKAMEIGK